MNSAAPLARMTYAEYLAAEETAEVKHEYLHGEVFAMAGGTVDHGRLTMSVGALLHAGLRDKPCVVLSSDVRVRIPESDLATYPDVSVVCGELATADDDRQGVVNPVLLVEVLSESTEAYDRGEKAGHYRRIPSLREYLLVSQKISKLELYRKNGAGRWELFEAGPGETLELASVGVTLATDEIYRDPLRPERTD